VAAPPPGTTTAHGFGTSANVADGRSCSGVSVASGSARSPITTVR
jgi:hypothetical protein